jgi:tetratricopeptide (TPR) repeat protein
MNLADTKLNQLFNPLLSDEERTLLRCEIATEYIQRGQYEAAREALYPYWRGTGERPNTQGLTEMTTAELLLQCGSLSGWLGTAKHKQGAQDVSKDLISEALRLFEAHGQQTRVAEAQYELAICYWRTGAFDEARLILQEAQELGNDEQKAKILIRSTLIEISAGRYHDALQMLHQAEPFLQIASDDLKGRWHGQKGLVLRRLATAEQRTDYADRAIIEFTAAVYHYEQAGHERYCATNLNNLAMLLYRLGRFSEAYEYLDRAHKILSRLKDSGILAQIIETRARVFLAEKRYAEALGAINYAIGILEQGGEQALLADALTVQATVQIRMQDYVRSLSTFRRAIEIAENAGALESAGLAALSMIEEHGSHFSDYEIYQVYRRADKLLAITQDAEDIARLRSCARFVMKRLAGKNLKDEDFYLPDVMLAYEARFVQQALEEERGSVTKAAKRLGLSHQRFIYILEARHRELLKKRKPPIKHRRSIIRKEKN